MKTLSNLNIFSKIYFSIGSFITVTVIIVSTILYVGAGIIGEYYTFLLLSKELILSARQCAVMTFFGIIIFETFSINNNNR